MMDQRVAVETAKTNTRAVKPLFIIRQPSVGQRLVLITLLLISITQIRPTEGRSAFGTKSSVASKPSLKSRGGSSVVKAKTRKRAASPKKKEFVSSLPSTSTTESSHQLPTVRAVLRHRILPLKRLIQATSLAFTLQYLFHCFVGAGKPWSDAVWNFLYSPAIMPANYRPSKWDTLLTRHVTLPPPFLPPATPLVGFLVSLFCYIMLGVLLPQWFPASYGLVMRYKQAAPSDDESVRAVLVQVPRDLRVYTEQQALIMCLLESTQDGRFYFDLCRQRYYFHPKSFAVAFGGPTLHLAPVRELLQSYGKGLVTKSKLMGAQQEYEAYNRLDLPSPTVRQALAARLSSPLVVMQLASKVIGALEDPDLGRSIFNVISTMAHHYWNAYQAIVSARELAQEVAQDQRAAVCLEVGVKRLCEKTGRKRWMTLPATALLPGDVFRLNKNTTTLPVDALLLEGTAVTNEAVLTGETVAQSKVPLADDSPEMRLDMLGQHRSSILFAGTFLQHCSGKLTCLALRTGSYSSRGDLVRALQRSRVGAVSSAETEQDGLRLILCLSLIACYTCISFWRQPSPQDTKPGQVFRKVLHCCRILMATIPSDLPMIISSIAHSCAHRLKHEADVVCSEPAALLTASSVNHILFDKTGTMTTDTQSLAMVRTRSESEEFLANLVLAGCHSLVDLNGDMIGDPLDLASFRNSGWNMNDQDSRRFSRKVGEQEVSLWQIKTFPFDASRRTSSSLVLVHSGDSSKLFKLVKGSPEKMVDLVAVDGKWFTNTTKELGEDGYRIVAMGAQDVSDDSAVVKQLFPLGLPCTRLSSKVIKRAQRAATRLIVRDSFECPGFSFCGFSCFSAVIRPSTPRVIAELKSAKIGVSMLTGDSVDAAVSVARRCRLIDEPNDIAVFLLDIDPDKKLLGWRKLGIDGGSNKPFESWESVTVAKHGGCTLIATGKAVEYLLTKDYLSPEEKNIQLMLPNFAIFARATPNQKVLVTRAIKNSGLKVLMCGDGVNDVGSMKAADCGVALLNGFGEEPVGQKGRDLENERRMEALKETRIGSNRRTRPARSRVKAGIGQSARASRVRVKSRIDEKLSEVKGKAALRQGLKSPEDPSLRLTIKEMRETFAAIAEVHREERKRNKLLRKGGAGAAQILAEEDKKLLESPDAAFHQPLQDIKPGEASLVSPFSCLRPAIDGVESILRYSIAASAYMKVMHQSVALVCINSAFLLGNIYKEGIRYGRHMWTLEFLLSIITEQASSMASCSPRPRIAIVRQSESAFSPIGVLCILVQSFIHLSTLDTGIKMGKRLERAFPATEELRRLIRTPEVAPNAAEEKKSMRQLLLESLVSTPVSSPTENESPAFMKLFQRAPFKPNFLTNILFLMSVFQTGVSTLVNHKGKPFYRSILEDRHLIVAIGIPLLGCLSLLAEGVKPINGFLELRSLPTARAQLCLFATFGIDLVGCWICSVLCQLGSDKVIKSVRVEEGFHSHVGQEEIAADKEEKLLEEESEENGALVRLMITASALVFLSSLLKFY